MNLSKRGNKYLFTINKVFTDIAKTAESKYCYALLISLIFSYLFYLNLKTPFIGDDYVYSFVFTTNTKISNIYDIIISQQIHYNVWGGRSVVHFILQVLLLIQSPTTTSVINSLLFVSFILVVQFHIIGKINFNTNITFGVFCLTCLIQPAFGETCLWLTGSVNYLWGTTIILYFLLPYRLYISSKSIKKSYLFFSLIMFLCGIITGWTNENTVAGLIVIISLFIIFYKKQKQLIPNWSYWGLIGVIIGYIIMIAAPGNFARASEAGSPSLFVIIFRLFTYTQLFTTYLSLLNLGLIVSFILYVRFGGNNIKQQTIVAAIYVLGVLVSIYSMIFSPSFPPRAWFGVITLNIIAFGIIFYQLNYKQKFLNAIKIAFALYCMFNLIFTLYEGTKDITEINNIWNKRIEAINTKQNTTNSFSFKRYKAKTKFGMSDAPYANKYVSNYYQIKFDLED